MLRTSLKQHADRNGLCVSEPNHSELVRFGMLVYDNAVPCSNVCYRWRFTLPEGKLAQKLQLDHIITSDS